MGWKKVQEYFNIEGLVHMDEGVLSIGSGYAPTIIQVTPEGVIKMEEGISLKKLTELKDRLEKNKSILVRLMGEDDIFEKSLPVYTWKDGKIVEHFCEEYDWPNITHDGQIMYENTFFPDRAEAVQAAIRSAKASIENAREHIDEFKEKLSKAEERLVKVAREYDQYRIEARASSRRA